VNVLEGRTTAIHSVALGQTSNLPVEKQTRCNWTIVAHGYLKSKWDWKLVWSDISDRRAGIHMQTLQHGFNNIITENSIW